VEGGRSVFLMRHTVLRPVHTSDNMYAGVEAMWATNSPKMYSTK